MFTTIALILDRWRARRWERRRYLGDVARCPMRSGLAWIPRGKRRFLLEVWR